MSTQITTAFVQQYKNNFDLVFQQEGSKLMPYVLNEMQTGEYAYYDYIGSVTAQTNPTRHADTSYVTTPHSRRRVSLNKIFVSDLIDDFDKVRMLKDPTSKYAKTFAHAVGRQVDQYLVDAAFGTAYAGKTGSTSVTWAASGTTVTDATSAGLTTAKLIEAKKQLDLEHVPDNERIFVCTSYQIADLLGDSNVISADYNTSRVLAEGDVKSFMGFKFVVLDQDILNKTGNGFRECIAFNRQALLLAKGSGDFGTNAMITPMPTKHYSTQVYTTMYAGATRLREQGIVKVQSYES